MRMQDLTMRQMREVTKALGLTAGELEEDPFGLTAALAWQVKKMTDPNFTFEQALDLNSEEVQAIMAGSDATPLEKE